MLDKKDDAVGGAWKRCCWYISVIGQMSMFGDIGYLALQKTFKFCYYTLAESFLIVAVDMIGRKIELRGVNSEFRSGKFCINFHLDRDQFYARNRIKVTINRADILTRRVMLSLFHLDSVSRQQSNQLFSWPLLAAYHYQTCGWIQLALHHLHVDPFETLISNSKQTETKGRSNEQS